MLIRNQGVRCITRQYSVKRKIRHVICGTEKRNRAVISELGFTARLKYRENTSSSPHPIESGNIQTVIKYM